MSFFFSNFARDFGEKSKIESVDCYRVLTNRNLVNFSFLGLDKVRHNASAYMYVYIGNHISA